MCTPHQISALSGVVPWTISMVPYDCNSASKVVLFEQTIPGALF